MTPPPVDHADLALSFLMQRLRWPVPMVRWRAAKQIRNLMDDAQSRDRATVKLLEFLGSCRTESEVCTPLTILLLARPEARPRPDTVLARIERPSLLASDLLRRTYGSGSGLDWRKAHSGAAPASFRADPYFDEHRTAHVPPVLKSNLQHLEHSSRVPLQQQWAFEWQALQDRLGTRCTGYAHYFDNVAEVRGGIVGQFQQGQSEIFRSAYLRTLAWAVDEEGMPESTALSWCVDNIPAVAGLFDVEPGTRPQLLEDVPERAAAQPDMLEAFARALLDKDRASPMRTISIDAPVDHGIAPYGRLSLSAHLVTPDFTEPRRVFRRLFGLSHAAIGRCSIMA